MEFDTQNFNDVLVAKGIKGDREPTSADFLAFIDFLLSLKFDDLMGVVLDISAFELMSSSGVGRVLLLVRNLDQKGRQVSIVNMNEGIKNIFELAQVESFFKFFDTVDEAVNFHASGS